MKKAIFARNIESNGTRFTVYSTRLTISSTGEVVASKVKFRNPCIGPAKDACPCIIEFDKKDANLVRKNYTASDGETRTSYTLWITAYKMTDEEYVDHTLDDIE